MKRVILTLVVLLTASMFSFNQLADGKETKQTVTTDEWSLDYEIVDDENTEEYSVYKLELKNIGSEKKDVKVFSFRNEPNKTYEYGLSINNEFESADKDEYLITFSNFPVTNEADQFEIMVMWKDGTNRNFKQSLIVENSTK